MSDLTSPLLACNLLGSSDLGKFNVTCKRKNILLFTIPGTQ